MAWRIEQAKSDRSSCRLCSKQIAKGEYRFGNDELNAYWYHLACAPEGKPRAFKPFAARAAKLAGAATPTPKTKTKTKAPAKAKPQAERNAELEARLAANPRDREGRQVFADWLQSQGDPWGEVIALELAGKEKDAKKLLKQHIDALTGGYGARGLTWKRGFIDRIQVDGSLKAVKLSLPGLLGVRAAFLVRELAIAVCPDAEIVRMVPKSLRELFTWLSPAVAELAVPSLERLTLMVPRNAAVDADTFASLLSAKHLPKLRRLGFFHSPLPVHFLRALLDSPLFAQLEALELFQQALDAEGERFVTARTRDMPRIVSTHMQTYDDDDE